MGALIASKMEITDCEIYGPMPLPGKRTTFCLSEEKV